MGIRVMTGPDGKRFAEECECRHALLITQARDRCRIPPKYEDATLENYLTSFDGAHSSLKEAHFLASKFVDFYPAMMTPGRGLLLTGSAGLGKTHLAVGILKVLVLEKGANGLFCYYQQLLKDIQDSYNPRTSTTELQILDPVFQAEILVLDDLGSLKPTDWVWDTVAMILNTRYNYKRTTIVTTNFDNLAANQASGNITLGDRIGDRMRSRLLEMCREVKMQGVDYRERLAREDAFSFRRS